MAIVLSCGAAFAGASPGDGGALLIDSVTVTGNERTSVEVVFAIAGISPGGRTTPNGILLAADRLRRSGLFRSVDFATRRGSERGHIRVAFSVRERGVEFGVGAGYQDLDSWYLIPAELRFDNRLGRGERTRLRLKIGYRVAGAEFLLDDRQIGAGPFGWGFSLSVFRHDRIYFDEKTEFTLPVGRSAVESHVEWRAGGRWSLTASAGIEGVSTGSVAVAKEGNDAAGIGAGEERSFGELPSDVASGVGDDRRVKFSLRLKWDSRSPRMVAGTPAAGVWGRATWEEVLGNRAAYAVLSVDGRVYRSLGPISFSGRLRGGVSGEEAPFYDRFYVGGIYTVRGFPNRSLSAPGGSTRFWAASVEMRAPLVGGRERPRLAGLLFIDAGDGWNGKAAGFTDAALAAGYGLRLRLPWVGWTGLDVGVPLSRSPLGESFHAHLSLGWTF